jgi:V8-like Glu-specific endopeptidase
MKRQSSTIVLTATAALATATAASVIGEDGRRKPGPDEADVLSASGLIVCSRVVDGRRRRSAGTGTVVGSRRTVLTAAHVFTDDAQRRGPPVAFEATADCVFRQYDRSGEVSVEVRFSHAEMGAFRYDAGAPNQDWAVLRTIEPLPATTTALPFATNGQDIESLSGLTMEIVAFHADVEDARRFPMLSEGALRAVTYGGFARLAHTADTGRMSSGAAIVHRTQTGLGVVVGINRSSANFGDFNLAVPLSQELQETLRSFAYGQVPARRQRLARRDPPPREPLDDILARSI